MNARNWPPLRRRPAARHSDRLDLTQAPEVAHLAASLPLPPPLVGRPRPAAPVPVSREPVTEVTCGFCGVTGLSSAIPDVADYGSRCADTDACARRWASKEAATRLAGDAAPPDPGAHPYPPADETTEQDVAIARADALAPVVAAAEAEAAPVAEEPAADATDDECPIEIHLHPDRFPCQLKRGHGGSHVYGPREPWPDEEGDEPEPAPATDATAVLVDIAAEQEAAKGPDDATAVMEPPTQIVPAVEDEGGEQA